MIFELLERPRTIQFNEFQAFDFVLFYHSVLKIHKFAGWS